MGIGEYMLYPGYLWGTASNNIWMTMTPDSQYPYYLARFDGADWLLTTANGATDGEILRSIWGASPSNIIAVGDWGTAIHFDGATWRRMEVAMNNSLNGVWGSSPSDVFAVGDNGAILHYAGPRGSRK
jgi:hypothetical protein